MEKFSFGNDPEYCLVQENQLKSAIGILSSKEHPKKIKGHRFYYDNVLAEIATKPGKNINDVLFNTQESLKILAELIHPLKFEIKAAMEYPAKELKCDQAKIAGCNPEWSVYTLDVIDPPEFLVDFKDGYLYFRGPLRTAGGHIHLGSELLSDSLPIFNVIRMMDLFIGIPSIFMDTDPTSKKRRTVYGLAGSHRIPEEGLRVEYRALGNFWLSSPEHVELIYDLSEFVLDFVGNEDHEKFWAIKEELLDDDDPSLAHICTGYDVAALQASINTCDKKQAAKFMMIVNNYLPSNLLTRITNLSGKDLPNPYDTWSL